MSKIARIQLVSDIRVGGPTETISSLDAGEKSADPYAGAHTQLHQGWLLGEEAGGVRAMKGDIELFFPWTSVAVVRYAPQPKAKP